MGSKEFAVSGSESCAAMIREDIVAVYPIPGLLAHNVKERILAPFEGKRSMKVWEGEFITGLSHDNAFPQECPSINICVEQTSRRPGQLTGSVRHKERIVCLSHIPVKEQILVLRVRKFAELNGVVQLTRHISPRVLCGR